MYLSKLSLNSTHYYVKKALSDCNEMHNLIMSGFPQLSEQQKNKGGPRSHFGVLYRIDSYHNNSQFYIIVQSQVKPDWSSLPENYCLPTNEEGIETKDIESIKNNLKIEAQKK